MDELSTIFPAKPDRKVIYRGGGGDELELGVYEPEGDGKARPAVVLFFGGGWRGGTMAHFAAQARHFCHRGAVAFTPQYRTFTSHGTTPFDAVFDARAAMAYLVDHADELRIDPTRLAAGGGSAGGHLAACTAFGDHTDGHRPVPLVLFNPVLDTSAEGFGHLGDEGRRISPLHHLDAHWPATCIFHGTADVTVPFGQAKAFRDEAARVGVLCELHPFEGEGHGFFNRGGSEDDRWFRETLDLSDRFLTRHGVLSPPR